MNLYASQTTVAPEHSRLEIERTLSRFGADQFFYAMEQNRAAIGFRYHGKMVRLMVPLPRREEFKVSPAGRRRAEGAIDEAWQQEMRRRWRSMVLIIKAKLEAVSSGLRVFEEEFLSDILLRDGSTVGAKLLPQVTEEYEAGRPVMGLLEAENPRDRIREVKP